MFSLICASTNDWANIGNASDLGRHRAHNGVTLMLKCYIQWHVLNLSTVGSPPAQSRVGRVKWRKFLRHYCDVIMGMMASQITSLHDCLLNRSFRRRSKKTSKLCVTGLCAGNSAIYNAENVSIWWRHHGTSAFIKLGKSNLAIGMCLLNLNRSGDVSIYRCFLSSIGIPFINVRWSTYFYSGNPYTWKDCLYIKTGLMLRPENLDRARSIRYWAPIQYKDVILPV